VWRFALFCSWAIRTGEMPLALLIRLHPNFACWYKTGGYASALGASIGYGAELRRHKSALRDA